MQAYLNAYKHSRSQAPLNALVRPRVRAAYVGFVLTLCTFLGCMAFGAALALLLLFSSAFLETAAVICALLCLYGILRGVSKFLYLRRQKRWAKLSRVKHGSLTLS